MNRGGVSEDDLLIAGTLEFRLIDRRSVIWSGGMGDPASR